jgi:enoyl-CoA hydratase/carnithine racemase
VAELIRGILPFIYFVTVPTIAAINGHAFAAGMMLSLACDYRVMTDGSMQGVDVHE